MCLFFKEYFSFIDQFEDSRSGKKKKKKKNKTTSNQNSINSLDKPTIYYFFPFFESQSVKQILLSQKEINIVKYQLATVEKKRLSNR